MSSTREQECIHKEFENWKFFLNNGIGLLSLNLAVGCLGTKTPSINAAICLAAVSILYISRVSESLKSWKELRTAGKENEFAREVANGIENVKLNLCTILKDYTLFIVGFIYLVFVVFLPKVQELFPFFEIFTK